MDFNELLGSFDEEEARFVRYSYDSVEFWEKTGRFQRGVPTIHVIQGVRDRFSSPKEQKMWARYDGSVRISKIQGALKTLVENLLLREVVGRIENEDSRYLLNNPRTT